MCWSVQQLLILVTLGRLSCGGDEAELSVSCPGHQRASEGSCYEFVAQERSFSGAQACCEERGGHLAFVPNKDTQHFLQRHLDPEKDVWLGVALSASPNLQYSATVGGALFWLDGSNVTYSNWASSPEPGAACGHILKDSGFQWEATRDCNKKLCFICQFESRRKVVCAGRDNTLRCGSGQVLMIDGGFYGRKNAHYCRPTTSSPTTSAQRHCGWVDVEESLRALCHGRQFCQIAELVTSAGEPCPQLGSYLSVDYQCKDGLTLSASTVAAVLTDITIDIKWLLHLTSGKPVCRLSTGDGHVIYLDSPEGLESSVVHKYKSPSTFVMAVECTSGDVHVTVQKIITISEPVTDISVTGCYAAAQSFHATNCKALHGGAFQIQMELKAGSNVTYRAQRDEMVLSGSSAERGNIPRNITVTAEMVKQLGPGCHQLTIFASNPVTIPEVSTDLQVCVLENVVGLWASVLMERDECGRSPHITVDVSLEKGAPVLLLFSLTGGDNDSFYESREMNARKGIFHIGHPIHGTAQVKLRARNVFSSLEVDVDMFDSCGKDSIIKPNEHNNHGLSLNTSLRTKHNRVTRSADKIQAKPSNSVTTKQSIQLSVLDASKLNKPDERYQWECKNPCKCAGNFENLVHTITTSCLPEPLEFFKYHFKVIKKKNNDVKKKESICITFTPRVYQPLTISFTCTQGCDPVKVNTDAKIKMVCIMCPQVVWNIEDPRDHNHWPAETKSCYEKSKKRPLIEKQNGGNEYTVKHSHLALAKSEGQDVTVVAILGSIPLLKTFIIKTSPTGNPGPTTAQPAATATTNRAGDPTAAPATIPTIPGRTATIPGSTTTIPGTTATIPGSTTTILGTAATIPGTTATIPGRATTIPVSTATIPGTATTIPVSTATIPGSTTTIHGTTATIHGSTATISGSTTTIPGTATTFPSSTATTPGFTTTIPGSATTIPGTAATIPGSSTTIPGTTATIPGSTTTIPGTATTIPGSTATIPGTITTTTATTRATTSPANTTNVESLLCSISPLDGTVLDAFNITCEIKIPCCTCLYCFKSEGRHLLCSKNNKVTSVFLPLGDNQSNYNLIITATAKNDSFVVGTNITTQVMDSTGPSGSSVSGLKSSVEKAVAQLKDQGLLSGETVGQIFSSVANKLNGQSDASQKADRQKLRERMLDILTRAVDVVPANTPEEVQVIARSLTAVSVKGTELSSSAQEKVALLFVDLSSSLLRMDVPQNEENKKAMYSAASNIVEGVSNILGYTLNKNISDALLVVLKNTQSALLILKDANEGPTIIQQANIGVLVNRVNLGSLHTLNPIRFPNNNCPRFSLPKLPSNIFTLEEPADIRMLCVDKNPFSWNERGNISGKIVALSLTTKDGATIRLENLSEDIEILFPRPVGERGNASVLDLGNYSTMVIDVPSTDTTLVLKMAPSKDPLPFKVFLGYMSYPTEANHVAMTEMPQQGTTQEQRYTWLVDPKNFRGKTGVHYLVVRPIVGPGIKSINASLLVTSISAACKFWNESLLEWSNRGCRVGVQTTHSVTQCLCNHLTFFGSSFFVTPNLVDPSRSAELFATFAENPVVVCFVGALFVAYLLVVVWARRKDIIDTAKVRVTVLEDNDPIDEYRYLLSVSTGHRRGASTSSQVTLTLLGADGNSEPHHLADPKKRLFESGAVDMFLLTTPFSLGDLQSLRLWHNNTGSHPAWYVGHVTVQDVQTNQKWHFLCNSWLAIDVGNCCLDQVFPVSSEMDLKSFSNLFFMKTMKDLRDGHLWYSVISRPPSSTFTCVQRVSCCFSLLLCTMLTSIMFYGIPTDPSEQTMDLGHFEFTWQQFMVGVQSSLVMFPVNILIVSIFRHTRPRETSCCKRRQEKPCPQTPSSQTASNDKKVNVTLDLIIKDITRIAHSLFLSAKSNIPFTESTEFGPGQQHDINAVLSAVDDFVRRNYKTGDGADRVQSQPSDAVSSASVHPATDVEGVQKSNKVQYLYRQLCHIDKELSLLGSSGFPSAHSYSQALQQVQGIKGFLEDQLLKPSGANVDGLPQKKSSLAGSTGGGGDRKKSGCCRGGLPWWFIFVGWLLVIATSSVAGYFTMIYGLKFGKERSISWLVSMIVSFFQSILVIQPLKVLCLAAFFALVIKKVDEEDFQNVTFDSNAGDCKDQQTVREDRNLYEPPPPADVDRMKRNKIMEQKAFALLREIFIYTGFMWMLLLVAHGQRDPNAFFLHQHIRKSFGGGGVSRSMSLGDVFAWANTSLLSNLFGAYPGFITDGNSRLVGNARLRQLRVQRSSCQIAGSMLQLVSDCHAPYSREVEDTGSYDSGWNQSLGGNATMSTSGPWTYQAQARLRARPLWGKMVVYRGGGFVAELGPDLKNASRTIEYLFRNKWLDVYTRAFIVEFTIYNANVNLFGIVTLLLETTAVGAFQLHSELQSVRLYQSTGSLHIFVMAAEVTYVLFIIYYMFLQGKLMKQQGGAYFRSKWNLLELSIIILSWSAVAVFITRTLIGNRDMTYYQNHRDQFVSFHETAAADSVLSYLIAFVLMLATVKLWHLLRLNPKMNMLTATLQRAWGDISSFLVVIGIMLVAYSTACNVIYGWKISSYRTFADALLTIISLQIGIFNYSEVLDYTPLLGGLLIGSCIVFMTFVVLNLLISVILVAFKQEQTDHKPSEEKEIVDLMLKKIYSFFGIRYDDKKDPRGPDTTGSSGPTLNTSRNLLS